MKKKWILPVCIVAGVIVICFVIPLATTGIMSAKGYGISVGRFDGTEDILAALPVSFDVQYIRTDGYHEEIEYPVVKLIRSVDELTAYYETSKEDYDLERKDKVYSDTTIGFLDACDKYDEAYFENQILVMVLLEEGSGSNRHKVQSVNQSADGQCYIYIDTIVPEVGTCDMAEWHILIEPQAGTDIESESDITVLVDGVVYGEWRRPQ